MPAMSAGLTLTSITDIMRILIGVAIVVTSFVSIMTNKAITTTSH